MNVNGPPPEWDDIVAESADIPTSLELLNAQRAKERPEAARAGAEPDGLKGGHVAAGASSGRRREFRDLD